MASTTVTITGEDVERMRDLADRASGSEDGGPEDGQLFDAPSQLSFNIGAGRKDAPQHASLKLAGQIPVHRDFMRREGLTVRLVDQVTGEVIAEHQATVTSIQFKDSTDQYGITTTERIHTTSWGS